MATSNMHPDLEAIAELFDDAKSSLDERGFDVVVAPHGGVAADGVEMGVRLDARPHDVSDTRHWSLSVAVDLDASNLVTILVDGRLDAEVTSGGPFPMPSDLEEQMKHVVDWFVSMHVPPA